MAIVFALSSDHRKLMGKQTDKSGKKISVLVADDHDIVRYGICNVIKTSKNIKVVCEANNGKEALELYKTHRPDVCIIDITMPEMNGVDTTNAILKINPEARIIILTMHINEDYLNSVLNAGAYGYILKNSGKEELLESILKVYRGIKVFSRTISEIITERYVSNIRKTDNSADSNEIHITKREKEILELIAEGHTSNEISELLFISPRTVDTHRFNLMQKLEIKNTAGLVRYAIENDIVKGH